MSSNINLEQPTFKHLCIMYMQQLTNFPYIEKDFDAITDYQLLCKVVDYLNQVIENSNLQNTVINNLYNAFIQLKTYVDNYFDSQDFQTMVNNKLEEMTASGEISALIEPYVTETLTEMTSTVNGLISQATNLENRVEDMTDFIASNKMNEYRKDLYDPFYKVEYPITLDNFFNTFTILTNNKKEYIVEYDINDYKNTSSHTYYISPNGNNSSDGSREHPWKSMVNAVNMDAGDTLIVMDGLYDNNSFNCTTSRYFSKSVNIIAEHPGKAIIQTSDINLEYTQDDTYTNVYHTTRSATNSGIYIIDKEKGDFLYLTNVNSLELCANTPYSIFINGSDVSVNLLNEVPSINNVILEIDYQSFIFYGDNFNADSKIYIEGLTVLNCIRGGFVFKNNTTHTINICIKDCKIFNNYSRSYDWDAMSNIGCNTICDNVLIKNSEKDGFNYHDGENKSARGLEINCTAINLGYRQTSSSHISNNGTTAHDSAQVIRVNGIYGYGTGGLIVDIGNSQTICYNCVAFDSTDRNYDIYASGNANIYVYDSFMRGSTSQYNLLATSTSHIYYKNCEFDTKGNTNVTELT